MNVDERGVRGRRPEGEAARCPRHPDVQAEQSCKRCGVPFCTGCLVQLVGQWHCFDCLDAKLTEYRTPSAHDRMVRLRNWVVALTFLSLLIGVLLVPVSSAGWLIGIWALAFVGFSVLSVILFVVCAVVEWKQSRSGTKRVASSDVFR